MDYKKLSAMKWEFGNPLYLAIFEIQREFEDGISRVRAEEILRERAKH